jgi:hypothetical protein
MTGQLPVRRASAAGIDSVASIVTLAFAHDPLWAPVSPRSRLDRMFRIAQRDPMRLM